MEALVPAFLLAVLTQLGDRPALLTAILADRYGRPLTVAVMAGLAHAGGNAIAAFAGLTMAPMLTPNAQSLLLALALLMAGFGGLWRVKLPSRLEAWHLGSLFTPLLGVFVLALGDRTQFFTLALATRGEPWFAAAGAGLGGFAVCFVAAVLGELQWRNIPFGKLRVIIGLLFLAAGAWIALGALRLL
ncbi:MAG: TMEM165/GDT1 family protein [Sphingomonas sp.]|uniref:TMEM165/GDT1 family protein n=1 Tax=Sphingomonas sp. TaxID=28214 RepID=UPI0025F3E1B5|nr:TMEM165/GDT1 family protein [Sphingomonas sp.]MBX3565714.1 TMEM165/GDT1 family protein [Sphingomonas sp.]